jgi:lipopolysaccharide/colanic/teichoic acid biosynthesis glycosyltransferase
MQRFFDVLFSFVAILILLPFMVPVMIALKIVGEHYVFYRQPRVGNLGKDFMVLKFATMLLDSPNMPGGVLTQKDDPRIIPLGRFLRKTKINELPQLVNILSGQMSFVGPRPQVRRHYELYSLEVKARLDSIPPGLTGIGSLVFRDEERILDEHKGDRDHFHDTVIAPYKGRLELWYADHRNLGVYFGVIFLTAWSVVRPRSAVYKKAFRDLPTPPPELMAYL